MLNDKKGFTLLELLIALGIMTVGFLAIAQMQFLSLKQKQKAEFGTTATNIIQFISDTDMAEVRRLYLLNSAAFNNSVTGRIPDFSYCDGAAPPNCPNTPCEDPCTGCPGQPCDVMEALTVGQIPNGANNFPETSCAPIETHNFDPDEITFDTNVANCTDPNAHFYIIKNIIANEALDAPSGFQVLTVTLTYAVKTPAQFDETGLTITDPADNNRPILRNSLATQIYQFTAHIDDWSEFIPGWTQVRVPHLP